MHRVLVWAALDRFISKHPDIELCDEEVPLHEEFFEWCKACAMRGYDGTVIVKLLADIYTYILIIHTHTHTHTYTHTHNTYTHTHKHTHTHTQTHKHIHTNKQTNTHTHKQVQS
jgi:hypothetical protein